MLKSSKIIDIIGESGFNLIVEKNFSCRKITKSFSCHRCFFSDSNKNKMEEHIKTPHPYDEEETEIPSEHNKLNKLDNSRDPPYI